MNLEEYARGIMQNSEHGASTKVTWLTVGELVDLYDQIEKLKKRLSLRAVPLSELPLISEEEVECMKSYKAHVEDREDILFSFRPF